MPPPERQGAASQLVAGIAAEFRRRLLGEYLPRIGRCVELLGEARCWQKPGPTGNSVANLLLHLDGNLRQWLLVTFAGEPDRRDRPAEFAAQGAAPATALLARLAATAERAVQVVEGLDADALLARYRIQQRYDETGLAAVLHVLEHCSGHAGQIYAWTKQSTGQDLRFYDL